MNAESSYLHTQCAKIFPIKKSYLFWCLVTKEYFPTKTVDFPAKWFHHFLTNMQNSFCLCNYPSFMSFTCASQHLDIVTNHYNSRDIIKTLPNSMALLSILKNYFLQKIFSVHQSNISGQHFA